MSVQTPDRHLRDFSRAELSALDAAGAVTMPDGLDDPTARRRFGIRKPTHASLVLAVILTTQLMVVLDATIVNVALPYIQRSLSFSPTNLSWVISGYTLTFGGLLLFGARCGDLLGRRRTFMAGLGLFIFASLAGGFATTDWLLLIARALQGVGGAFAAPATLALLTSIFPEGRERVRAIGLFTAVSVGGAACGMIAGGVLIQLASWRWVFFVNVPIGIAVIAVARFVLPETARSTGQFDIVGALTSTLGVGSLVFGFVEAGSAGWASAKTLASFIAGVILLAVFVRTEKTAEQPILPLRLLDSRTRSGANAGRALLFAGSYGMFFFLTQFLQDVRGYSALRTGFAFVAIPVTVFSFSQLTTRVLIPRFNAKLLMLIGMGLSLLGLLFATQIHTGTPYAQILVTLLLFGMGNGIGFVTLTGAALSGVDSRDAGAASGVVNVTQQLGPAIGVAILATVFATATGRGAISALSDATFTHGLDSVFWLASAFAGAAVAVVAFTVPSRPVGAPAAPHVAAE